MFEYSSFEEASWLRWAAKDKREARVCIMGVPFDNAVSLNKGTAKAPERLRSLSVDMSDVTEDFREIKEGILYDFGDMHPQLDWESYFSDVEEKALEVMETGGFPLFIGGDHSVTIPLQKAFARYYEGKKIGVIHFDAHYDLCPEYDGHKWSHACTEARALEDVCGGEDLSFVGIRVAELIELELMKEHPGITTHRALDVYERGAKAVAEALVRKYADYDAVYLTLDIDVLDPAFAPGTGTPVAGGLSSRELIEIFKVLIRRAPIKAMDLVEVAPPLDVNDVTSWAALRIIHEVLGKASE
ncbi:agmatinase [Anaerovorax odorimutans]|uniref:Agmatinase n=1 Tax=Anaerovorax odorimutans TaxID=109327 RepID=A0ABT1RM23_9FIRM|nr:agmatinase [Anaerovorax odorimutans]MCQ4636222.1 agmatinase [Anaerovorax odorimutans]